MSEVETPLAPSLQRLGTQPFGLRAIAAMGMRSSDAGRLIPERARERVSLWHPGPAPTAPCVRMKYDPGPLPLED